MLEPYMNYISLIYGLIFLVISFIFLRKTGKTTSSSLKNIFWAFTAFSIMKAMSVLSGLSIAFFPLPAVINTFTTISYVISNIFLFHFGISILTYKTAIRINYKIFPFLLVIVYTSLYFSGIIELPNAERISRYSLGFNGAFLGSIGYFNIYKIKKASGEKRLLSGLILYGIALLVYSLTEGIIINPVLGIQVEFLRLLSAIVLLISSFFVVDLLKEDKKNRIGFI